MEEGQYYHKNLRRISGLSEEDWVVALVKAKEHIYLRLRQKTSFGAHHSTNLGADPIEHYLSLSYTKIISGEWEWKDAHSLAGQMILIIDSYISKEVCRFKSQLDTAAHVEYRDDLESSFYDQVGDDCATEDQQKADRQVEQIEAAIDGDDQLVLFWEAIKEGYKAKEIAGLLDMTAKQLSKLREKFIRKVRSFHNTGV